MKIKSLTKEPNAAYIEGSTTEIKGGAREFVKYLADDMPWQHLLQGMKELGIERQVFSTSLPDFNIRLIIALRTNNE